MSSTAERVANSAEPAVGTGPEALLHAQVRRCRRRLTWQTVLWRLVTVAAIGALYPLLVVMADHAWPRGLPRGALLAAAAAWVLLLAGVALGVTAVSLRRRLSALFAARLLERRGGIRFNSIVNAVLLRGTPEAAYAYGPAARRAALDIQVHPPARLSEPGVRRRPAVVAGLVLAVWVLYALVSPKEIWPSLARFFGAPWPAPTATRLVWIRPAPTDVIHAGDDVQVEVGARGRIPDEVVLEILPPDVPAGPPQSRYPLHRGEHRERWQVTLAPHEVTQDIHYRCVAGDAVLAGVIPVRPRPELALVEIRLEPPAYTNWPAETTARPHLDVLVGTRASFRFRANTPVRDAVFVLSGERETRTRMGVEAADPTALSLALVLVNGGEYRVELSDAWGCPQRDPPQYRIVVRPDSPPAVQITEPAISDLPRGPDESPRVDVTRVPELLAVAEDDVRVDELVFVTEQGRLAGQGELAVSAESRQAKLKVRTAGLALSPGQQLRAWFEARDNRVLLDGRPEPQLTKSAALTLFRPAQPEPPRVVQTAPAAADQPGEPGEGGDQATGVSPGGEPGEPTSQAASEPVGGGEESAASGEAPSGSGSGDEQGGSATAPAGEGGEGAPTTAPAGGEAGGKEGGGSTEREGSGRPGEPEGGGEDEFEPELRRFVEKNGQMARDVARRFQPPDAGGGAGEPPDGQQPPESQPTEPGQTGAGSEGEQADDPGAGAASQPTGSSPATQPPPPASQPEPPATQPAGGSDQPAEGEPQSSPRTDPGGNSPGGGAAPADNPPDSQPADDSEPEPLEPPRPPRPGPRLESTGLAETIGLLEMLRRGEDLSEDSLVEMGWPAERAAAFIKDLQRVYGAARRTGRLESLPRIWFDPALGEMRVQAGVGWSPEARGDLDPARARRAGLQRIAPPAEQEVPAHLRAVLDAYYRSLAQQRGGPTRERP